MGKMHGDQCSTFGVWYIILLILIVIILLAIVWNMDGLSNDLKKKVILPIQDKVESIEAKFASAEAKAKEIADRLEAWEKTLRGTISPNIIEKGKLALENLAFNMMCDQPAMKECIVLNKHKKCR